MNKHLPTSASSLPDAHRGGLFPSTAWSMISGIGQTDETEKLAALDRLARAYWHPLHVFARSRGMTADEAADAVQGFFGHLISRNTLKRVERQENRFRTFLLAVFRNWLADQYDRSRAQKRGGGVSHVSLEAMEEGQQPAAEPPENAYDRAWAAAVYDQAMSRLAEMYSTEDRSAYFAALKGAAFRTGTMDSEALAAEMGMSAGGLRKAIFTLRARFAKTLRMEVARCMADPADVDAELSYLIGLVSQ